MNFHPSFVDEYIFNQTSEWTMDIHNIQFNLKIHQNPTIHQVDLQKIKKYLNEFLNVLEVKFPSNVITKTSVNITIYDIPYKKELPLENKSQIQPKHINSAYCYVNSSHLDTNIVIYRSEELYKVLIHELLHFFDIIPYNQDVQNIYATTFSSIKNTLNVNEALVELHAICFNCHIIANLKNKSYLQLLQNEYKFSIKQIKKLLSHQNIQFHQIIQNDFFWNEKSNAFSYFILKHIFLHIILEMPFDTLHEPFKNKNSKFNNNFIKMSFNAY